MDVSMIYFSQTGNTRKVAEAMAQVFEKQGHVVKTLPLGKATPKDAAGADLLGVGAPCFAGHAPTPVRGFLRDMPRLDGRRVFVFATSGGAPGRVLYDMTRFLRRKGGDVVGGFLARGELFYPPPSLVGRFPNRPDEEDLAEAQRFAASLAEHISAGIPSPLPESRPEALKRRWGPYEIMSIINTDAFLRLSTPKPKLNSDLCDQCRWCAKECPVDNIDMQPYPVLGKRCIRCFRCLTGCPRKAFEADWRFANPVLGFIFNQSFERRFGDLGKEESLY